MKNSDLLICLKTLLNRVSKKVNVTIVLMVVMVSTAFTQEPYVFMEGSVHKFAVTNNPNNSFVWSMYINPYTNVAMAPSAYDLINGGDKADLTIRFNDLNRSVSELVYLVVEETAPNGCSTKRAMQIQLEPNNMYLDFAALPNADDCYNFDDNYQAQVQVGMNFTDRGGLADAAIPVSRFPIKVKYTVEDKTNAPGTVIDGNGGEYFVLEYKESNDYFLEVSEAKGSLTATTEYELTITDVVDKYDTHITHDVNRRVQIRVINHLPQTGGMDMAMAYVLTPIEYLGSN